MFGKGSRTAAAVFLLPPLLLYLVAVVAPIIQSLYLSFFSWNGISPMRFEGLGNYERMLFADDVFRTAFVNSLVYVAVCLIVQLGVGLFVASLLTHLNKGREVIKTLYLLPAVISTVAISLMFQQMYSYPDGLFNQLLTGVGLESIATPWLSNLKTVLVAVSLPEGWRFSGLYMLILYAALISVPKELEEAARLDGASEWRIFTRIRFPYIRPVWYTTLIMATTYALRGFDIPYLLTNGGPGQASELLTTYMYKQAFTSTNFGYASAVSVFIVVECLVALGLIFMLQRRKADY